MTAVRNSDEFFAQSIDSVLGQTYPNVEYVVADGGSTDRTVAILESYGDRIDYWVSEPDQSMFDGMNRGVALASGQLVRIHGADDVMPPNATALAVERHIALGNRASMTVIRGDMEVIDKEGRQVRVIGDNERQRASLPVNLHPTWFVPMGVYERWGLYDPNTVVASDYEMYFYLLEAGVSFEHIGAVLSQFRSGGTSSTFAGFVDGFLINRRYHGLPKSTYLAATAGASRVARLLLEAAFGSERVAAARRHLKQVFTR